MTLYGYFRSSAAYRCRIAFNLKGLKPNLVSVHLRKGEQRADDFLKRNPQGFVPALETAGQVLTQSLAIIEWLEETHPEPALLPRDPFDRALVRALALTIACDIHPLQNLRVLTHLRNHLGQDQAGIDAWCRTWIESGLGAYERMLVDKGCSGGFSFGATPTLADACLIPQVFSAERFGADLTAMPTIRAIADHAGQHPAFAAAHPARQPDYEA
ncbi:MAG TPA: maleylacetoacetate isomerase [Beijerinckiaceae bacterium]|nr:maleylacetoacetate isomerase [Beijerinckiaceae bacterium]